MCDSILVSYTYNPTDRILNDYHKYKYFLKFHYTWTIDVFIYLYYEMLTLTLVWSLPPFTKLLFTLVLLQMPFDVNVIRTFPNPQWYI